MAIKRDKKEEEDGGNPFQNLDKTSVLQDARTFNDTPVNPRKCTPILTKILYLLNQGEQLGTTEATETFFAMTKLFQSKNAVLRRMVYLGIKELSTLAEDVIIVTSSLTKDMTGKEDLYRAAAIRALCSITDATMLQTIERYMKQAIVDKNASVASAALVSSLHMSKTAGDVVKRWVNEAQEATNSDSVMVQYHALGLLYHIRKSDRLAVTKLVAKLTRMPGATIKSPFAVCMLIRIACKQLESEGGDYADSPLFDFVESCLRHKSETVIYEAAAAMVNLRNTTARQVSPAVSVLQLFCSSSKAALRFAAVRTLNKVAMTHPPVVMSCNMDLEGLIADSNRSIATLAITTLLKTGAESAVDRLMKQIASFVSEISDEFKIVVVQAIRALCLKFPRKHGTLMTFLSAMLRDEGGLEYKVSIADTIITIIEDNPEAKEIGLAHLCEFIEDCEHVSLAVRILHLLGKEGPKTVQPSRYIRFIYNRVILEIAVIRAAAVSALAQFGALCPDLLPNVLVLLARCQMDTDDEVRDRATYYYCILSLHEKMLINNFIVDPMQICLVSLEKALAQHLAEKSDDPFDLKTVPPAPITTTTDENQALNAPEGSIISGDAPKHMFIPHSVVTHAEKLQQVPQLQFIPGLLFHVSEPVELTESETEYVVICVKHSFPNHIVLQFDCKNTLSDQLLENVYVQIEPSEGYTLVREIPISKLPYNETHSAYVVLQYPEDLLLSVTTFGASLRFIVKDCDPATGIPDADEGYDDEYMLEEVQIGLCDQVEKVEMDKEAFERAWESSVASDHSETEGTYNLPGVNNVGQAFTKVTSFLGLTPTSVPRKVPEKSSYMLCLPGVFRGGINFLIRAKLAESTGGVSMHLTARSAEPEIANLICAVVA